VLFLHKNRTSSRLSWNRSQSQAGYARLAIKKDQLKIPLPLVIKKIITVYNWANKLAEINRTLKDINLSVLGCYYVQYKLLGDDVCLVWIPTSSKKNLFCVPALAGDIFNREKIRFPSGGAVGFLWTDSPEHYHEKSQIGSWEESVLLWKAIELASFGVSATGIDIFNIKESLHRLNVQLAKEKLCAKRVTGKSL